MLSLTVDANSHFLFLEKSFSSSISTTSLLKAKILDAVTDRILQKIEFVS